MFRVTREFDSRVIGKRLRKRRLNLHRSKEETKCILAREYTGEMPRDAFQSPVIVTVEFFFRQNLNGCRSVLELFLNCFKRFA